MRYIVVVFLWAMLAIVPAQAETPKVAPALEDFLGKADLWSPTLSPSGRYITFARREGEKSFLLVVDLEDADSKPSVIDLADYQLNWAAWKGDDRVLISVSFFVTSTGQPIPLAEVPTYGGYSEPSRVTRIMAMDRSGNNRATMFTDGQYRRFRSKYGLGNVISFLPNEPDSILMALEYPKGSYVYKLDINDGAYERFTDGPRRTTAWYTDRNGDVAFRFNENKRGTIAYIFARESGRGDNIKSRKIRTIPLKPNGAGFYTKEFAPLYPGPTDTTYYVTARPEGQDKAGIYLYDFEKDEYLEKIKVHEDVDIEQAIYNWRTQQFQGVMYHDDHLVVQFHDPEIQEHIVGLKAHFEDGASITPMMSSSDARTWLMTVTAPNDAGSYHIYDIDTATLRRIGSNKFSLTDKRFGRQEVVKYQARDGLELRGYLTRPADFKAGDKPPLIMMPHGGPESRDFLRFDYYAQILAAHGYQVFQPNFRGSSGFGLAFADMGRREWGGKMQHDIDDAFDHLVQQGYVDRDRACIFGASYGGYAALAAATLTPDMYQCIIATAAPTDLVEMLRWERKEEGSASDAYKYWVNHMGDPRKESDRLSAVSPAKLANQITRPILLIHGDDDRIVPIEQSELMAKAMDEAGKSYQFLKLENTAHSYRSDEDERKEYEAMLAFLDKHLPVTP